MSSVLIVTLETDSFGTMERSARGTRSKAPAKVWFHIFVKLPRGLMTSLRVHADMTVGELQGMVEEASGIPCDVQKVTTSQNSGPDKELLLGQLGLRAGSTVSVGPDDRWRDVFGAAMMGDYWRVRRCLDGVEEGETRTNGRFCAMFLAAHRGHLDLLQKLLADGQDVNRTTTGGRSALLIAHARGHSHCVDVLLDQGADSSDLPNGQVQRATEAAPGEDKQQGTEESPTFNPPSSSPSVDESETGEICEGKSQTNAPDAHESSSNGPKNDDLIAPPNGANSQSTADPKRPSSPKEENTNNPSHKIRGKSDDDEVFDRENNGQADRVDRLKQLSRARTAGRRSSAPVVSLVNRPNSALVGRVKTWGGTPQPRVATLRRGSESSEADDSLAPLPGLTPRRHHPATITADTASILKSMSSREEVEPTAPPNSPRRAFIGLDPACPPTRPRPSLSGRRLTGLRRVSLPAALPSTCTANLPTTPSHNQKKTFDEWLEEVEERKKFEEEQKTWDRLQEMHEQALREDAKYKKRLSFDDWNKQKELEKIHKMEEQEEDKDKNQQKERRQKISAEEYQKWVLRKEQEELEKERQKQKEAEKDYQRWLKLKEELQEVEKKLGRVSLRPKSTQRRMSLQYAARS